MDISSQGRSAPRRACTVLPLDRLVDYGQLRQCATAERSKGAKDEGRRTKEQRSKGAKEHWNLSPKTVEVIDQMLMVKTRIAPSSIAGIGVFADQDIPAGTVTWRFVPGYDLLLTQIAIDALPEPARSSLLDLAYYHAATELLRALRRQCPLHEITPTSQIRPASTLTMRLSVTTSPPDTFAWEKR